MTKNKNQIRVVTRASIGMGWVTVGVAARMGAGAVNKWIKHFEKLSHSSAAKSESVIPLLSQGARQLYDQVKPFIKEWRNSGDA